MRALRAAVSGSRVRFTQDGFDLDLTYITPKLIAMSYPASGVEKTYRNDINEVAKFLNSRHPNAYRVYNLSERTYDYSNFDGRVKECGFPQHHPPPLQMLIVIVNDMMEWVAKSSKHVLVVHSLTGNGRVGIICSCYLLLVGYYGEVSRLHKERELRELVNAAIRDFWNARGDGVQLPSQALYIYYFARIIRRLGRIPKQIMPLLPAKKVLLHKIALNNLDPSMRKNVPLIHVLPAPSQDFQPPLTYNSSWQQPTFNADLDDPHGAIIFEVNAEMQGDTLIRCLETSSTSLLRKNKNFTELFHFTFNTDFFHNDVDLYQLPKVELDEASGNDRFPSSFNVVCHVQVLDLGEPHGLTKSPATRNFRSENSKQPIESSNQPDAEPSREQQHIFTDETIEPSESALPSRHRSIEGVAALSNRLSCEQLHGTDQSSVSPESYEDRITQFATLFTMCEQMEETRVMCEDVLERLQRTQLEIDEQKSAVHGQVLANFIALQASFGNFLMKFKQGTTFKRLVSTRTIVGLLRDFHNAIDIVESELGGVSVTKLPSWMNSWEHGREQVEAQLLRLWESNALGILSTLPDQKTQEDALLVLCSETTRNRNNYSAESNEMLELVTQSVARLSGACIPVVPGWFIPDHEVQRELHPFARGSFGMVYRGTWRGEKVVVKCVDVVTADDKRTFSREARIWLRAQHPNVVKFYGACHLTNPSFFVCEEATNGNLADFLSIRNNVDRALVWRLLHNAALGLQFLHQSGIIHGDLKCNQILVSDDGVAKLTDFGLSFVSLESRPTATSGAVRWKAPELLTSEGRAPTFSSDIYSFGMCVVEAVSGCVPWGIHLPDQSVIYNLMHDTFLARPKSFASDEQWEFVGELCRFEPSERLHLAAAIEQLEQFAEQEQQLSVMDANSTGR